MKSATINYDGFWIKDMRIHEATQRGDKWVVLIQYEVEIRDTDGRDVTSLALDDALFNLEAAYDHRPSVFEVFGFLSTQFTTELYKAKKETVGADLRLVTMPHPITIYIPADMPIPPGAVDVTPQPEPPAEEVVEETPPVEETPAEETTEPTPSE